MTDIRSRHERHHRCVSADLPDSVLEALPGLGGDIPNPLFALEFGDELFWVAHLMTIEKLAASASECMAVNACRLRSSGSTAQINEVVTFFLL